MSLRPSASHMIAAVGDDEQPVEVVGVCERAVHEGTIALYQKVGGKGTDT